MVFEAISINPGIQHKDLALKEKQSASQLSQFVGRVAREGLIIYNRVGREKYYYLQKYLDGIVSAIQEPQLLFNEAAHVHSIVPGWDAIYGTVTSVDPFDAEIRIPGGGYSG